LLDWEEQKKRGDVLPDFMLVELEQRMAKFNEDDARNKAELKAQRKAARKKQQVPKPQTSTRGIAQLKSSPKKRSLTQKVVIDTPAKTNLTSLVRQQKQLSQLQVPPNPVAPVKHTTFHGIESNRKIRSAVRTDQTKATRTATTGAKFRNLRHMNLAQKKALAMPPPMMKKISTEVSSKSNGVQSPSQRRGSSASDDSQLFFPESKSGNAPMQGAEASRAEHPVSASSPSLDVALTSQTTTLQIQPNHHSAHPSGPEQVSGTIAAPQTQSTQEPIMTQNANHRPVLHSSDLRDSDTAIQLQFGEHMVGTVVVTNFPGFLRSTLRRLKSRQLPLYFDQGLVFTAQQFANASSMWPYRTLSIAGVYPMTDAADALRDLAAYLNRTNCAAIWEHPDPDDTIGFMLYSPTARDWAGRLNKPEISNIDVSNAPLVLEAKNRAPMGQRPIPLPRQDIQPATPAPTHINPQASLPASAIHVSAAPANQGRRSSTHSPHISAPPVHSPVLPAARPASTQPTIVKKEPGWKVFATADEFKSLIEPSSSTSKPFVYVAFEKFFPEQAQALQAWAGTQSNSRFVYTDADDGFEGLVEHSRGNHGRAILLLLHDAVANFCDLKGLHSLLGMRDSQSRDFVHCHAVTWQPPTDTEPAKYKFTRLFPRGTTILITERMMLEFGKDTVDTLKWFRTNGKDKGSAWQIMVRPRIREWLQHKALTSTDAEKQQTFFDMLGCIHRLSGQRDVTIPDHESLEYLGISDDADENSIVPLPAIDGYDDAATAESDPKSVLERDELLVKHFVYWTITDACRVSRRFIVLDDHKAKMAKTGGMKVSAGHIRFSAPGQLLSKKTGDD
jgi:hypothetical protein